MNTFTASDIASFYDDRVYNPQDLNTRLSQSVFRPAHHHAGLLWDDVDIPEDTADALVWMYQAEERLSDYVYAMIAALSTFRPKRYLDLGCGEGGTALRMLELGGSDIDIMGITLSVRQQEAAKRNCPIGHFVRGNFLEIDLSGTFDVWYSIEATEYLGRGGLMRLMERAAKFITPGGLLVVVAGSMSNDTKVDHPLAWAFDQHYKTKLCYSGQYLRFAKAQGFRLAANVDLGPATLPYWIARRDRPDLRNSTAGVIEEVVTRALQEGVGEYHLWAWYREA